MRSLTSSRPRCHRNRSRQRRGFTLLEAMVALIIFGIITLAISSAMSVALHAQALAQQRQEDGAVVRAVVATLSRDLQAAYGSMYDPNSVFMTGAGSSSSGASSAGGAPLLTFAAMVQRVITTDQNVDPSVDPSKAGAGSSSSSNSTDPPQNLVALIRYDLDKQSGTLTRIAQAIPNLQTIQSATPSAQNVIASGIVDIQLQFWDPNQQNWRSDWDFEQQNLPAADTAAQTMNFPQSTSSSSSSSSSTSSATASPANSNSSGNSDVQLPTAVQITVSYRRQDGTVANVSTILPIAGAQVQDFPYVGGQNYDPNSTPNSQTSLNTTTSASQ